jgi:hypothetical protein
VSKPSRVDPERLAALLEGKLSASQSAEVRAALAASDPEAHESFADAAAVAAELGIVAGADAKPAPRGRRSIYGWSGFGLLAAAALVFAAVRLNARGEARFDAGALIAPLPATVAAPITDAWPAVRGVGDDLAPSVRAARLGATLVDFELAARAGDGTGARRKAAMVTALGDGISGAGPVLARYRALASGGEVAAYPDTARDRLDDALAAMAGRDWVNAGAAAEALRAAAESGDGSAVRALCDRTADLERNFSLRLSQPAEGIKDSLLSALAERPCRPERIGALSSELLGAIAR